METTEVISHIINICQGLSDHFVKKGDYHTAIEIYNGLRNATWLDEDKKRQVEIKRKQTEASKLFEIGRQYQSRGDLVNADTNLCQSLGLAEKTGDKFLTMQVYSSLANVLISAGKYEKAAAFFQKQLNLAIEIGDRYSEAMANINLSNNFISLSNFPLALEHAKEGLRISQDIKNKEKELQAHMCLGEIHDSMGKIPESIASNEKALELAKMLQDRRQEGRAYGGLGNAYYSLADFDKSLYYQEKVLEIATELGNDQMKGDAYNGLGLVYHSRGYNAKAISYHEKALEIERALGNRLGQGLEYGNLGNAAYDLSEYQKALTYYTKCLEIVKEFGNKEAIGMTCFSLGNTHYRMGDYRQALKYQQEALKFAKATSGRQKEGNALGGIGNVYYSLNEFELAIKYYEQNLEITKEVKDRIGEGNANGNLGNAFDGLGRYEEAVTYHSRHLRIASEVNNKPGEARANGNLGIAYYWLNDQEQAIVHHKEHLRIAREIGDKMSESRSYGNFANSYRELGDYEKAFKYYNMKAVLAQEVSDRQGEATAYYCIATLHYRLEDWENAKRNMQVCITKYKEIRQLLRDEDSHKVSIGDQHVRAYKYLALIYLKQLKQEEAFLAADRGRAMALTDLIRNRFGVEQKNDNDPSVVEDANEEGTVKECLLSLQKDTATTTLAFSILLGRLYIWVLSSEELEIREISSESKSFFEKLVETVTSALATVERDRSCAVCEGREIVSDLDGNFKDYFAVEPEKSPRNDGQPHNSNVHEDPIKPRMPEFAAVEEEIKNDQKNKLNQEPEDNDFESEDRRDKEVLPPKDDTLHDAARNNSDEFGGAGNQSADPNNNGVDQSCGKEGSSPKKNILRCILLESEEEDKENPLSELYNILVKPVEDLIRGDRLLIIPEDLLYRVPFCALVDSQGQFLTEKFSIQITTSLQTLALHGANKPEGLGGALIIGNPKLGRVIVHGKEMSPDNLPGAQREAQLVAKYFNTTPLVLEQATKARVMKFLPTASVVHIAAHGDSRRGEIYLAPSDPTRPGLSSEEDFLLTCSDIAKLRLRARLVVLSCCQTACGTIRAEGVIGIARSFLGAGASSVIVTLWAISDRATEFFMDNFFKFLLQDRLSCSTAVRSSMNMLRQSDEFKGVTNWAPFYVVGQDVSFSADDVERISSNQLFPDILP